eukprot:scaffold1182_cov396-Prasinococcus_capsulatus_cf.AAC.16
MQVQPRALLASLAAQQLHPRNRLCVGPLRELREQAEGVAGRSALPRKEHHVSLHGGLAARLELRERPLVAPAGRCDWTAPPSPAARAACARDAAGAQAGSAQEAGGGHCCECEARSEAKGPARATHRRLALK